MSRIELHCPSCGYDVPPTLMPPPKMFSCPECLEIMPREKLTRLKVLHRNIAGANTLVNNMSATVVGSNTFYDPTQATGSITVSNCVFATGDCCVVFIGDDLTSGGSGGPSVCTIGGLAGTSLGGGGQGDQSLVAFVRGNLTSGTKSIVVNTWAGNPTACAVIVIAVSGALRVANPSDGFSTGGSLITAFDSGLTSALVSQTELAIAGVGSENNSLAGGPTWNGAFLALASGHVGTNSGGPPNDTLVDVAFKKLLSSSALNASGTIPNAVANACSIVTIKPA